MSAQFAPVPGPSWTRVDEMPERSNDLDAEDEFEDEEVRDGSVLALARWAAAQRAFVDHCVLLRRQARPIPLRPAARSHTRVAQL